MFWDLLIPVQVAMDFPELEVAKDGVTMNKYGLTKVMKVPKDSKTLARAALLLQTQLEAADRFVATLTLLDKSLGYQLKLISLRKLFKRNVTWEWCPGNSSSRSVALGRFAAKEAETLFSNDLCKTI